MFIVPDITYDLRSTVPLEQLKCNTLINCISSCHHYAAKIWNDSPYVIKNSTNLSEFIK